MYLLSFTKNHFTHILDTQMLSSFSVILFYTILSTYSIIFNMFEIFKIKINFFAMHRLKKLRGNNSKMLASLWVMCLWVILTFFSILSKHVLFL